MYMGAVLTEARGHRSSGSGVARDWEPPAKGGCWQPNKEWYVLLTTELPLQSKRFGRSRLLFLFCFNDYYVSVVLEPSKTSQNHRWNAGFKFSS